MQVNYPRSIICSGAVFTISFLLSSAALFSQPVSGLHPSADKYCFSEELYFITDRDFYIAGEEVNFKLYCFDRLTHSISAYSKVAYITLLNKSNDPVLQKKIGLSEASGSGSLTIPDTLSTGRYFIAACTRWMQNSTPELFAYKSISVVNPFYSIDKIKVPPAVNIPDKILFFPESGIILSGKETSIGYRSLDKNMNPIEVSAVITDASNNILAETTSDKNGYGLFTITPSGCDNLFFNVVKDSITKKSFTLPEIKDVGYALSVSCDDNSDNFLFRISYGKNAGNNLYLVYAPASSSSIRTKIYPSVNMEVRFQKAKLPGGLARIMITDDNGEIFADRWVYNSRNNPLAIEIRSDNNNYLPRQKARVEILLKDNDGNPVKGDLSISVSKSFAVNRAHRATTDDVQMAGLPALTHSKAMQDMNNRLLFYTPGTDLSVSCNTKAVPDILPEPEGHLIGGTIFDSETLKPIINEHIVLSIVGKASLCSFTRTDSLGHFFFVLKEPGTSEIVIQPLSQERDGYYVELDNPFPDSFSTLIPEPLILDTTLLEDINKAIISMQVKRIYDPLVPKDSIKDESVARRSFYGEPESSTVLAEFIELVSLQEAIKEIVPGVITTKKHGKTQINTLERFLSEITVRSPLIMVDGVPTNDHEKVLDITLTDIDKIDVINRIYFIGDVVLEGIIDIKTYKGDLSVKTFGKPVYRREYESVRKESMFVSPDYSEKSRLESRLPDFRNTLYWNPDVKTDENGKATVEFYTSDEPGFYTVAVKGFTADGNSVTSYLGIRVTED